MQHGQMVEKKKKLGAVNITMPSNAIVQPHNRVMMTGRQ